MLTHRDPIELSCEGLIKRSQVCKHQVCDYCGGRFGMVTHRWWGGKFCKRACKNAYLRENDRTPSGWLIPRFFFTGGACLAAAVAVAVLALLVASANAAPGEEQPAAGVSLEFDKEDGTLYVDLSGSIVAGMADDLRAALGKYETTLNRVAGNSTVPRAAPSSRELVTMPGARAMSRSMLALPGKMSATNPRTRVTKSFCSRAGSRLPTAAGRPDRPEWWRGP